MNKKVKYLLPIAASFLLAACDVTGTTDSSLVKLDSLEKLTRSEENISLVTEIVEEELEETEEEQVVEEEPVVEDKISNLLAKYDELTSDSLYKVEEVESSKEEYAYALEVSFQDKSISVFFNEVIEEEPEEIEVPDAEDLDEFEEDDDEEEEIEEEISKHHGEHHDRDDDNSVKYAGIIVLDDVETEFHGKRIVSEEATYTKLRADLGDHKKLTFESYVSEDSTIFSYQIAEGWYVSDAFYYEYNKIESGDAVDFVLYNENEYEYYSFETLTLNDATYFEVDYSDATSYGSYQVLVNGDEYVVRTIEEGTYDDFYFDDDEEDEYDDFYFDDDDEEDEYDDFYFDDDDEYDDCYDDDYGHHGHGHYDDWSYDDYEEDQGHHGEGGHGHHGGHDDYGYDDWDYDYDEDDSEYEDWDDDWDYDWDDDWDDDDFEDDDDSEEEYQDDDNE